MWNKKEISKKYINNTKTNIKMLYNSNISAKFTPTAPAVRRGTGTGTGTVVPTGCGFVGMNE